MHLDPDQEAWDGNPADVFVLPWKDCKRLTDSPFIYRIKAWHGRDGKRKLRVQKHHIYEGRVGRRVILLMKVDGRIVDGA